MTFFLMFRSTSIRLLFGRSLPILSPYFAKAKPPEKPRRKGYHANWREPIKIVIQWMDADGNPLDGTVPLYDATMGKIEGAFTLLGF